MSGSPVSFTPGFNASRSADATHFTSAGTQTLTITVTPQQALPNLGIDVNVGEDENVTPTIISPTTDEANGIWLWEGQKLNIQIPNLPGTPPYPTYTYEVVIQVVPKVPDVEFMPSVSIGWGENTSSIGDSGTSFAHTIADLGTWTWSTADSYVWEWGENLQRNVHFKGYSRVNSVYVGFGTGYNYNIAGDNFVNGEVAGNKTWGSNLERKGTVSPAIDVRLTLDSALTFNWINPEPYTIGPPIEWHFGDVAPDSGVYVDVGPMSGSPVSFIPGFNASRSADATHFSSAGTQTLTITVTPQQALPNLGIDVNVGEDENVTPTIISPTTDEANGIWLWEGQKLNIQIPNLPGTPPYPTYTYEVVIQVVPKVAEIEFMPTVGIGWGENTDSDSDSGNSFAHTIADLGTWTWSTAESYVWEWGENLQRSVQFNGYSKEIFPIIPHVPMIGQKLVGQGIFGPTTGDGDTIYTVFSFTNPDCVREITIEKISIFRMDGTVAYEGPLLAGTGTATMKAHETRGVDLNMYISHNNSPGFYTVEIFWSETQKGLPLIGWSNTVIMTQDGGGNAEIKSLSQTLMVNMVQALEADKGKTK
jgi:hypothetical protein